MALAAAGLRMELRRADIAGVTVHTHPLIPPQVGGLYLPDQPAAVISDHLDAAGQRVALAICLAHHRLGHKQEPDPQTWARQQHKATALALEMRVPLEDLVRGETREWTAERLAAELGLPVWAVSWRREHLDPWEARLVTLGLTG